MVSAVAFVVGVAALVIAALVFVAHARPDAALGLVARATGDEVAWLEGRLSEDTERRLVRVVEGLQWPLTALVFAWGFVAGALMALSQS